MSIELRLRSTLVALLVLGGLVLIEPSIADNANGAEANGALQIPEITVTARKRVENLQDVPDAISVFTAATIQNADIQQISDFAALTPNLTYQENTAFSRGQFNLSLRGIGNGALGWASVSYLVDGVPVDSQDAMNSFSLVNIERIEVLRGPQSALYGFNAIAGAINIVTKKPGDTPELSVDARYGNGDDRQFTAIASGPIVHDLIAYSLTAMYEDDDGLIRSASNGLDLDFALRKQIQGRMLITPNDRLQIDVRAGIDVEHVGSTYQDKVPSVADIDNFSPTYDARRGFAGYEDRQLADTAIRIQWDFDAVSLISISGFDHLDQYTSSGLCYDDPSDPILPAPGGGAQCLFGTAYGDHALPGQSIDEYYDALDNYRTFTEDVRLESRRNDAVNWILGASTLHRTALDGFDGGDFLAPSYTREDIYSDWDGRRDEWWGLYGQATWKVTPKIEFMAAGRYDKEKYWNTGYTTRTESIIVPTYAPNGTLIDTQEEHANAFQPKGQVSYHFTDAEMGYVTVSRGFRAGFYQSGQYTLPEHSTNYELGLKSTLWDRRIVSNAAVFHIDYSNQQFTTDINTPPFIVSLTIPKTNINGAEYESTLLVSRSLSFGLGLGYLHAVVADGTKAPAAPSFNASATMDFTYPIVEDWNFKFHLDDRFNASQYLDTEDSQPIPSANFVNLRTGVAFGRYEVMGYMRNATDERIATFAGVIAGGGYVRSQNEPRSYGIDVRASF